MVRNILMVLFLSILLLACGGGDDGSASTTTTYTGEGSGSSSSSTESVESVELGGQVVFPPGGALTTKKSVTIRGLTEQSDSVASVSIDGNDAVSTDDYETWSAAVDLAEGENEITIYINDHDGKRQEITHTVIRKSNLIVEPFDLALDKANNRMLVLDNSRDTAAIYAVDLNDKTVSLIAGNKEDSLFKGFIDSIEVDLAHDRAFLVVEEGLLEVNLVSGAETLISSDSLGSGADIDWENSYLLDITYDADNDQLYLLNSGSIYTVDQATGNRVAIASDSIGSGDSIGYARSLVYDTVNDRLIVAGYAGFHTVDIATGNRDVLAEAYVPVPPLENDEDAGWVMLDAANNRLLVTDYILLDVHAVDLDTGSRTVISSNDRGNGPSMSEPTGIAYDAEQNIIYIADSDHALPIIQIDPASGDRTEFLSQQHGEGPHAGDATSTIVLDKANNRAITFAHTWFGHFIMSIDLTTGERERLSAFEGSIGSFGLFISTPYDIAYDGELDRLYVSSSSNIVSYDLSNGLAAMVSGVYETETFGGGNQIRNFFGIDLDKTNGRLLITSVQRLYSGIGYTLEPSVYEVAVATGDRALISGGLDMLTGSGPELLAPREILFDADNDRFLLTDSSAQMVFAVDAESGDRSIIADFSADDEAYIRHSALDKGRYFIINNNQIMEVDLSNGAATLISSSTHGVGPYTSSLRGLAANVDTRLLYYFELGALMVADMVSGDRVILSK